ncbi:transcriptional regulator [Pseudomonas sp.]|uniref:transcriptional regulator n=1 Tax=Pseudomonas sp. TaxID=306 RepID=UPI003FD7A8EA
MNLTTTGIMDAVLAAGGKKGMGQSKLARALGVTPQAVSLWVSQGYVPVDRIVEIESLYGVPRYKLINPKHLVQLTPPQFDSADKA